jgi:putative membrane protein
VNYLIKSNTDVSAFTLTSGILQNNREALDLGFEAEPDVQTLEIDNGERLTLAAPWVHPGPLGGFGGGQLSGTVINELNERGNGFFLHVPCTHEEDLADPEDAEKILEAIAEPDRVGRASTLLTRDYGPIEFHGRRINGTKVIFLHAESIDDYDPGVFLRDVDKDDVLLVDLHRHDIQRGPDKEIQYGTSEAETLKRHFDDFRARLEGAPLHEYRAGFDVRRSTQDLVAVVERVADQEVLLMGIDTNGVTRDMRELQEKYRSEFDRVLLFSTDTHASIHELANTTRSNVDAMREAVETATASVSPATIGLTNQRSRPLDLLKNDYNGLVFSVNILIRLAILMLVLLYVFLVVWMF